MKGWGKAPWGGKRSKAKGGGGGRQLFVDGLLPECEDQDLRDYFSEFGSIKEASVALEKDTSISRCFATISFYDAQVTQKVLGEKHEIWGAEVMVIEHPPDP